MFYGAAGSEHENCENCLIFIYHERRFHIAAERNLLASSRSKILAVGLAVQESNLWHMLVFKKWKTHSDSRRFI
jgi:hypothetical protein